LRPKKKKPYVRKDTRQESNQMMMLSSAGLTAFGHLLSLERSNIISEASCVVNIFFHFFSAIRTGRPKVEEVTKESRNCWEKHITLSA